MTTCKKCGADVLVSHATATCRLCQGEPIAPWPPSISGGPTHHTCYPGEERREMCSNQQECNLRAELRDVKAQRDALSEMVALHERRQVIFEESDRDLRSAVLLIAKRMEDGGPASSDLLCIWANELRKAVT